jgi:quinohemoprotein amine dehydrogenase
MRASLLTLALGMVLALAGLSGPPAAAQTAESLVNARCGVCHVREDDGTLDRINAVRKTPEGWLMTLVRMERNHGLEISDEERRSLVKHLSDTQGLAPSESAGYRYALERTPGALDGGPTDLLTQVCARCHLFARAALQRRDREDWLKLVHFHLGQYPTTEYQALGRDRDWFGIATTDAVDALAELLAYESDAWTEWQQHGPVDISGVWRVAGRAPGGATFHGMATLDATGDDNYNIEVALQYPDGSSMERTGKGVLYAGHEYRGTTTAEDGAVREVLQISEDGTTGAGRAFFADNDVIGSNLVTARIDGAAPQILQVEPAHIRQGETQTISIHGVGLSATETSFGDGVTMRIVVASPLSIVAEVTAAADAEVGARDVTSGVASAEGGLVVYDTVDRVAVEPETTISRVGGGAIAGVPAQFEAVGYMDGPDGAAGTEDDVRIGVFAAAWAVEAFDEAAEALGDAKYSGSIDENGLFTPAEAGPNPERHYGTNNVGNLAVVATVADNGREVEGRGHLFATVQRFIDTPIR